MSDPKRTHGGFEAIIRMELSSRGIPAGPGYAAVVCEDRKTALACIVKGKAYSVKLDKCFETYMAGRDFMRCLKDALDKELGA